MQLKSGCCGMCIIQKAGSFVTCGASNIRNAQAEDYYRCLQWLWNPIEMPTSLRAAARDRADTSG